MSSINRTNGPIINCIHGECLRTVSDSIAVIGCPYDGPAGLVSTEKKHLLSTNENKALFLWSRRPGSEEDVSQDSHRSERTKLIGSTHMGTGT